MQTDAAIPARREFLLTDGDFTRLQTLVHWHTGIVLSEAKRELVYSRISRRLRQLGLVSFEPYCALLEAGDDAELVQFVNAITTHLTAFFREVHHFDYLATTLLPALLQDKVRHRLRLWSAGCSTGEEPYSLAMVVQETLPSSVGWDTRILATEQVPPRHAGPPPGFAHIRRRWEPRYGRYMANLLPGEYYVTWQDEMLVTVLGSCISACIRDPAGDIGGMNHFMLPLDSQDTEGSGQQEGAAARYGKYAMELLINGILQYGGRRHRLEVKIFGGGRILAR